MGDEGEPARLADEPEDLDALYEQLTTGTA